MQARDRDAGCPATALRQPRTLSGPSTVAGTVGNYEALANGILIDTGWQRVIGPVTFDGQKTVEVQSEDAADFTVTITASFNSLPSAGLLAYGSTNRNQSSGTFGSGDTTIYSPADEATSGYLPPCRS